MLTQIRPPQPQLEPDQLCERVLKLSPVDEEETKICDTVNATMPIWRSMTEEEKEAVLEQFREFPEYATLSDAQKEALGDLAAVYNSCAAIELLERKAAAAARLPHNRLIRYLSDTFRSLLSCTSPSAEAPAAPDGPLEEEEELSPTDTHVHTERSVRCRRQQSKPDDSSSRRPLLPAR
ncbi:unnamed protein product [Vitrella brassicaformis CCMP3155]|uniref:Uncharacterized protein n=1 Tax=Vitrella brassicaformis (strain CCMP3155) TaxID=1169540 RepID=A0A0G4FUE8_VITBC|nr:unnamed protein product [Vitrella brassicaformis CCMP3155]|eukprot:CEM18554.1 unnamed protein product [Vitrella brassicaformis CCMP3155]